MIYPESFEQKIGFAAVREMVKARCISTLGAEYCVQMKFSSQYNYVNRLLLSTAEMLAIINGEEALPLGNIHDMTSQLKAIRVPGTFIPATDLLKVRQSLGAIIEISSFFSRRRVDESTPYPVLDDIAQKLSPFPLITATIDRIIDRFGNVKDNASPALAETILMPVITWTMSSSAIRSALSPSTTAWIPPPTA